MGLIENKIDRGQGKGRGGVIPMDLISISTADF